MRKSISAIKLDEALQSKNPPMLFDVRKKPVFESDPKVIQSAKWQVHDEVTQWVKEIPQNSCVVVYCVHGHEVSQNAALKLRDLGFDALFLEGGIAEWIEVGFKVS